MLKIYKGLPSLFLLILLVIIPAFSFSNPSREQPSQKDPGDSTCPSNNNNNNMPKFRSVKRVMLKPYPHCVGDGFNVFSVFADLAFKEDLSPLLMFDYAAPKKFGSKVGRPRGVGQVRID